MWMAITKEMAISYAKRIGDRHLMSCLMAAHSVNKYRAQDCALISIPTNKGREIYVVDGKL